MQGQRKHRFFTPNDPVLHRNSTPQLTTTSAVDRVTITCPVLLWKSHQVRKSPVNQIWFVTFTWRRMYNQQNQLKVGFFLYQTWLSLMSHFLYLFFDHSWRLCGLHGKRGRNHIDVWPPVSVFKLCCQNCPGVWKLPAVSLCGQTAISEEDMCLRTSIERL